MSPQDYTVYRDTTRSFQSCVTCRDHGTATTPTRLPTPNYKWRRCSRGDRTILFTHAGDRAAHEAVGSILPRTGTAPITSSLSVMTHGKDAPGGDEAIISNERSTSIWFYTKWRVMPKSFSFPPEGVQGLARSRMLGAGGVFAGRVATAAHSNNCCVRETGLRTSARSRRQVGTMPPPRHGAFWNQ